MFAADLNRPFGIAFYPAGPNPQYVYVGNTDSVVRFPYQNGDLEGTRTAGDDRRRGAFPRRRPFDPRRGVLARRQEDVRRRRLALERRRSRHDPGGKGSRRRCSSSTSTAGTPRLSPTASATPPGSRCIRPRGRSGCSVNERDNLGDNLVPDYISHIEEGGFYGWPWYYLGGNQDPRLEGKHPELKDKVKVPDVLLQPHSAPLGLVFYSGSQFARRASLRHLRGVARLLEQGHAHRLQGHSCAAQQRRADGRVSGLRHRVRHAGRAGLGTPGGRCGRP